MGTAMSNLAPLERYDYLIDANDRIVNVGETWSSFALENESPNLAPERVIGTALWDHITGPEVKHLYRSLFDRLRGAGGEVHLPFRCDSPKLRRYMQMSMRANSSGGIELTSKLLRTESRAPVSILGPHQPAGPTMIEMCSFCKRVIVDSHWSEIEVAVERIGLFDDEVGYRLTHGVCPDCHDEFTSRLKS